MREFLSVSGPEDYPGQHQEMLSIADAPGCDITEHVSTLVQYGKQVDTITEMGVRFGWSTRSFLFAKPSKLHSIDKFEWNSVHQSGMIQEPGNSQFHKYQKLYSGKVDFTYQIADTTKIPSIEPCDLLFIDTFHHRDCLSIELNLHGNQARKYIILHDTETFGECGQADDSLLFFDRVTTNEPGTGLRYSINSWLSNNKEWSVKQVFANNNGLTVLERS